MTQSNSPAEAPAPMEIVITRVFDAPCRLVWRAWTDPEQVVRWWAPKDFTSHDCTIDFRVGGKYHFCMRSPEGQDFWTTGVYLQIVENQRIVYTDSFADADGNVVPSSYYGMEGVPETQVELTFEALGSQTRLILKHVGIPQGEHSDGAKIGWGEMLDKLAATLQ